MNQNTQPDVEGAFKEFANKTHSMFVSDVSFKAGAAWQLHQDNNELIKANAQQRLQEMINEKLESRLTQAKEMILKYREAIEEANDDFASGTSNGVFWREDAITKLRDLLDHPIPDWMK